MKKTCKDGIFKIRNGLKTSGNYKLRESGRSRLSISRLSSIRDLQRRRRLEVIDVAAVLNQNVPPQEPEFLIVTVPRHSMITTDTI